MKCRSENSGKCVYCGLEPRDICLGFLELRGRPSHPRPIKGIEIMDVIKKQTARHLKQGRY